MTAKKVSIVTLGCLKNAVDTANLTKLLKAKGHEIVTEAAEADAIVVHTCSFIEAAKKESIDTILEAGRLKTNDKQLIVSGCLVQQHGEDIFKELPEVDAFLGTGQLSQVADILDNPRKRFMDRANPGGFMDLPAEMAASKAGSDSVTGILRLSEGCSHPCSFCVIPRLRGPVQSRSFDTILREAKDLAAQGVEEFSIIAQDSGDWGRDDGHKNLPSLLRSLAQVPGIRWVRLMYMHPASFTEDLLTVFAEHPDKFPYLDMPFQHIDSTLLTEMRRKTDEAGLRDLLERIKKRVPSLTLRTTFIVGFPGETSTQFKRLKGFVQEGWFDYLGAFAYSKEEGTPAAARSDQILEKVKKERLTQLTNAYYDVAHAKAQTRLGTTETVLLEETEGDTVIGRSRREAPEIDAIIRMPQSVARQGRFATVTLTGYDSYEFTGVPLV